MMQRPVFLAYAEVLGLFRKAEALCEPGFYVNKIN